MVLSFFTEIRLANLQIVAFQQLITSLHTPSNLCNQTILGRPKVSNIKQLEEMS